MSAHTAQRSCSREGPEAREELHSIATDPRYAAFTGADLQALLYTAQLAAATASDTTTTAVTREQMSIA